MKTDRMGKSEEAKSLAASATSGSSLPGGSDSTGVLIAVNTLPALGVLFFGWDVYSVVFLYWLENLVIGPFCVLKIVTANSKKKDLSGRTEHGCSLVPIFCIAYGIFMVVHLQLLWGFLGDGMDLSTVGLGWVGIVAHSWHHWMWVALAILAIEHGREFLVDYLKSGKNKRTTPSDAMFASFLRIIVLHLVLIVGGFIVLLMRLPRLVAVVLVVAKVFMELANKKRLWNPW